MLILIFLLIKIVNLLNTTIKKHLLLSGVKPDSNKRAIYTKKVKNEYHIYKHQANIKANNKLKAEDKS